MPFLETIANFGQNLVAPLRWTWAMLSALRWAWNDMRDLPASIHLALLLIEAPDHLDPPRLKFRIGVVNSSVFDVQIDYDGGRPRFLQSELSGPIDSIHPTVCKPRELTIFELTQWISPAELKLIQDWQPESKNEKSFDLRAMRFPLCVKGLRKKHYLEFLGTHPMAHGGVFYFWHGDISLLGDRWRARGQVSIGKEPY